LEITTTDVGDFRVLKIIGKVDWENARLLENEIEKMLLEGKKKIVFNLDEVTFLCSGGIGVLMYSLNKIKADEGCIYLVSSSDYVNYIFETLKFNVVFEGLFFKSYEEFEDKIVRNA